MAFAVVGGDARFTYLTRFLREEGRAAFHVDPMIPEERSKLVSAENVVMHWPEDETIFEDLSENARVYFCGPSFPKNIPDSIKAMDLWSDETLLVENARLTAEGAIAAVMQRSNAALRDCPCLVVGWGRIGRALTEMLMAFGTSVLVASHSEKGCRGAMERGAEGISVEEIKDVIGNRRIVFSTPPFSVIGARELRRADSRTMIVDLASAPYGVDLAAAEQLGLRAWREPKLPGRYCPYSAARALQRAIHRAEGAAENETERC